MRTTTSIALLLLISLGLGTGANLASPHRIPWVQDWSRYVANQAASAGLQVIDLAQARAIVAAGTHIIFDARPPESYGAGNIPGALSLPSEQVETVFPQFAAALDPATPILVYCSGEECDESLLVGTYLHTHGYTNVTLFPGGYTAWAATPETGGMP